jgi:hypothetical protein
MRRSKNFGTRQRTYYEALGPTASQARTAEVRNRLKNDIFHKLLDCYINLRLLQKLEQDFLGQCILENADDDNAPDEEEE